MTESANPKLQEMYQSVIMRHFKAPVKRDIPDNALAVTKRNPLCGDESTLYEWTEASGLQAAVHSKGCALCVASASILTAILQRSSVDAVKQWAPLVAAGLHANTVWSDQLTHAEVDLQALRGAQQFPVRLKCVRLPWDALINET